jgi:hypothetical protein
MINKNMKYALVLFNYWLYLKLQFLHLVCCDLRYNVTLKQDFLLFTC